MRLDLRTRPGGVFGLTPVLVRPDCYGCADCEQWFQFAWQLLAHDCEARERKAVREAEEEFAAMMFDADPSIAPAGWRKRDAR